MASLAATTLLRSSLRSSSATAAAAVAAPSSSQPAFGYSLLAGARRRSGASSRSAFSPWRPQGTRAYADKPTSATDRDSSNKQGDASRAADQGEAAAAAAAAGDASRSAFPSDPSAQSQGVPGQQQQAGSAAASRRSTSAFDVDTSALVAAAEEQQGGDKPTGARSRGSSASSQERSRRLTSRIIGVTLLVGTGFVISNLGRDWDTVEERERFGDDPLSTSFLGRLRLRLRSMYTSMQAPVWEKLLPDPLPFPYQRPYTLVLDVDDLLIHSEWSRAHAWRTAKRPGLDYFLGYLAQFFEIVIYSRQPVHIVGPVVEKLDPDARLIQYSLFRESCRTLDNGHVVKDLNALNRDLSKVIAIDTDATALELNPENAIVLKPWKGDSQDRDLLGLVSFLEAVGIYQIPDVRDTLRSFAGTHIPTEHARRQAEIKAAEEEQWKAKHGGKGGRSMFGGIRDPTASGQMPKSWFDLERERYQQGYVEEQKFWQENGEKLRQQAKDEQEKKLKEMKLNAWG